ncbi:GntR family transcriptional regulator [Emcibacter sp.]|uniref:GntR family transcriptional regulator n=1 Tax=Emcibacter sp. TaxID=1979954 RepID=UPI002AA85288|nr:GntR family transcriptional regulator [Emcibacter sp.]
MRNLHTSALSGKTRAICEEIEKRLVRGFYRFGDEILANDLVKEFGASRAPVMAAMNYLRAEGYLIITPQVGCKVISPTPSEIKDFFFVFGRVEGAFAAMAAERHDEKGLGMLRLLQQQIQLHTPKKGETINETFVDLVADFHQQIYQLSHSRFEAERATKYFRMSEFFLFNSNSMNIPGGEPLEKADKERAAIVEAIAAGDADTASKLMEEHVRGKPQRAQVQHANM